MDFIPLFFVFRVSTSQHRRGNVLLRATWFRQGDRSHCKAIPDLNSSLCLTKTKIKIRPQTENETKCHYLVVRVDHEEPRFVEEVVEEALLPSWPDRYAGFTFARLIRSCLHLSQDLVRSCLLLYLGCHLKVISK